ncbi:MAG TPA: hypothetical protein VD962_13570 [Rubricoccaceae bacterium]|nr:hypothetical protein [Rubricoccaceae bacterium]
MRAFSATLLLAAALWLAVPAHAQLRSERPDGPAPADLYGAETPALGGAFSRSAFRLSHSYEFSYSAMGGSSLGLGVYTTSLQWQPTHNLAARVDVGVAHSPFGSADVQHALGLGGDTPARVFLRNAEVAYRPTGNTLLRLQIQQSPYGAYASPYGYGAYGYGYPGGTAFQARFGSDDDVFWRTR